MGIAVGASFILVETLVVCSLNAISGTTGRFGTLYILGVLLVSMLWRFGLSVTMSVASAIAFTYFRNWPAVDFAEFEPQNWFVIGVLVVVALVANVLAGLARAGERFFVLSPDVLCIAGRDKVIRINLPSLSYSATHSTTSHHGRISTYSLPKIEITCGPCLIVCPAVLSRCVFENRVICTDGSQRWVEWSVVWHRGSPRHRRRTRVGDGPHWLFGTRHCHRTERREWATLPTQLKSVRTTRPTSPPKR